MCFILTFELNADGDMVKDAIDILALDGLHLDKVLALCDDPLLPDQPQPAAVHHLTIPVLQVHGPWTQCMFYFKLNFC